MSFLCYSMVIGFSVQSEKMSAETIILYIFIVTLREFLTYIFSCSDTFNAKLV